MKAKTLFFLFSQLLLLVEGHNVNNGKIISLSLFQFEKPADILVLTNQEVIITGSVMNRDGKRNQTLINRYTQFGILKNSQLHDSSVVAICRDNQDFLYSVGNKFDDQGNLIYSFAIPHEIRSWEKKVIVHSSNHLNHFFLVSTSSFVSDENNTTTAAVWRKYSRESGKEISFGIISFLGEFSRGMTGVIDEMGNLIVAGYTTTSATDEEPRFSFLTKLEDHKQIWTQRFSSPIKNKLDYVALDKKENVYAAGYAMSNLSNNDKDIFFVKLNKDGQIVFKLLIGGDFDDYVTDMKVMNDKVYLTGLTRSLELVGFKTSGHGSQFLLVVNSQGQILHQDSKVIYEVQSSFFQLTAGKMDISSTGDVYLTRSVSGDGYLTIFLVNSSERSFPFRNLMALNSSNNSTTSMHSTTATLSSGAISGIVIGILLGIALLIARFHHNPSQFGSSRKLIIPDAVHDPEGSSTKNPN